MKMTTIVKITAFSVLMNLVSSRFSLIPAGTDNALQIQEGATMSILQQSWTPLCTSVFLNDDSTPITFTLQNVNRNSDGISEATAVWKMSSDDKLNSTRPQLSIMVQQILKLQKSSRCLIMLLFTNDADFLGAFLKRSTMQGLLKWPTRLLLLTSLSKSNLHPLRFTLSAVNAMVVINQNDEKSLRAGIYIYMPYSQTILQIASWTPTFGLTYRTQCHTLFPDKFSKLTNGAALVVAAQGLSPYLFIKRIPINDEGDTKLTFYGPSLMLLDLLASYINFTFTLAQPPDGSFGRLLPNGSWNGMVGMVIRKDVDFALGPFAVTYHRAMVIDFTTPLLVDQVRIMGRRGDTEINPWGFALPFTYVVWLSIFTILLVVISATYFLYNLEWHPSTSSSGLSFSTYIRVFLQQDILGTATFGWEQVMLGGWLLSVFVIIASYKTNLMSLLAVRYISEPYQTWRDMLDDSSVKIVSFANTAQMQIINEAKSGIFHEVAQEGRKGRIKLISVPGFVPVVDKLVSQGDHVFLIPYLMMKRFLTEDYIEKGNCKFYSSKEGFMDSHLSLVLQKNSPLLRPINEGIRGALEGGLYSYWLDNALPNERSCKNPPTKITVKSKLSMDNLWGMFVVLLAGYTLSLSILYIECLNNFLLKLINPSN